MQRWYLKVVNTMTGNRSGAEQRRRRAKRGSGALLRESILDAADDLLVRTRDEKAVCIRSVAQSAGVTPPAIYLHFVDKTELMNAVCVRHLERLGDVLKQAATGQSGSFDVLRAQGMAYVRWAIGNAEIYRIALMGAAQPGNIIDEVLNSCICIPLSASIQTLMGEGAYRQDDPSDLARELWAAVHGVASLLIARPYFRWGVVEEFADRVITNACWGLLASTTTHAEDAKTRPHPTIDVEFVRSTAR